MSDISSFWDVDAIHADWQTGNGVLTSENDMHTAIIISLFTDGLARADDDYEGTDRRGWWGIWTTIGILAQGCGYCGVKN